MRPIRSAARAVLASVILAASVTGCQSADEQQPTGEILIAADLELSGAAASAGQAYQRALELKVEQINQSGVLGGQTIRLEVKDNRSDPNESLRNIGDFTANPAVQAIIIGNCADCAIKAATTIADKRVPTIALAAAGAVANPVTERRYLFKLAPNAADNAAALVAELERRPGIRSVGLLHTNDKYGLEGAAVIAGELSKTEIELIRTQRIKVTDSDAQQSVRDLVIAAPDALVIWTSGEQAISATVNAREAGYRGEIFLDAGAAGGLFLGSNVAKQTNGTTMVFTQTMVIDDVIATTPAKAARKQWFRDYTARYGNYNGSSSFAADAVQLIVDAALRARSTGDQVNRDGIRDVLETSQMDGLSGPIRMTPDNHSGLMPQALTMLVARDGRWRLVS
ncbi:MAG TPA: ABC transporter substrate-binding protein [Micromonospora sp.]|nr:ABC transporter substrate-binding protein [Micromonospora sp.]